LKVQSLEKLFSRIGNTNGPIAGKYLHISNSIEYLQLSNENNKSLWYQLGGPMYRFNWCKEPDSSSINDLGLRWIDGCTLRPKKIRFFLLVLIQIINKW
jgi:hypothetical protein